jgi:hypothetical protein
MPNSPQWWYKLWHYATRWSVRIIVPVGVAILVLARSHPEEQILQMGFLLVLILFVSEQLIDISKDINKQIEYQASRVNNLVENYSPKLLSLHQSVQDMQKKLSLIGDEKVVIDHIGLDMTQAWQYFEPLLRNSHIRNVEYRLLILTDDATDIKKLNEEVGEWCNSVNRMLNTIQKDLESAANKIKREGRTLTFIIKKYKTIPIVHGFRINEPFIQQVSYLAFCRWGEPDFTRFDWGEPRYHRISGHPQDEILLDLFNVFDGHFNHFWNASNTPAWWTRIQ